MKRFQVTSVDVDSNDSATPGTKNEVLLNANNLHAQSNATNGKITFTNNDVESARKFSFAQLTR